MSKVYEPDDAEFLITLITELEAIRVRSRGESIALHVALRDLGGMAARADQGHAKGKGKRR